MEQIKLKGGNKMKNKVTYGIFAVVFVTLLTVGSVAAFGLGHGYGFSEEEQAEREAFRTEVKTAMENGDFETWKYLMQSRLTEKHFTEMQEQHNQMQEMQQLREQLREAWKNGNAEKAEQIQNQIQESMPEGFPGQKGLIEGHGKGMKSGFGGFKGNCPFADAE